MTPYTPPEVPLEVIHADSAMLVAVKPAGLLSVPGRGPDKADCLSARLGAEFGDVLTVHRLDMETSGLMVFARTGEAQRALSRQFETRTVYKAYVARLEGEMKGESGVVDLPLIRDWPNRPLQKVCLDTGKPSRTRWRIVSRGGGETRVVLQPITGRSHQLRVHMAALGHPILGDTLYGSREGEARMMLHAGRLRLDHPVTGERQRFASDAPF